MGTSTSTSVHGGVTILTESRWQTCKSSGGSRRLGGQTIEDRGDMRRVVGDAYGVHYLRAVWWVKAQNHQVHGFMGLSAKLEQGFQGGMGVARGKVIEVVSRQSKSVKEAWPSDRQKKSWTKTP